MNKKDNKGFTLIEIIISMAILSIVIFISYNMINNMNHMFNKQLNTTNSQISANDLNRFLSRDIQYSVNIEGPIFSKNKSDGSKYTLNNISKNDEVNYQYKITTNKNKEIVYLINIINGKYSICRTDYNGISLEFIDEDKIVEDGDNLKAPLVIEQSLNDKLLYLVNLQCIDKKVNGYSFKVAARYQLQNGNQDNSSGNINGNQEGTESPDESFGSISNKDLVFEYEKLYKFNYNENYNWKHTVTLNLDQASSNSNEKESTPKFSNLFVIRRYGDKIEAYTSDWSSGFISSTNSKVTEIKGFRLKFQDGIKMKNIKFMDKSNYEDLNDSSKVYTFKLDNNIQNIEYGELLTGYVEIEENSDIGDIYKIEIEFIY